MASRNTDLEQVKLVAHALLDVEIQPTEFSPMIVSHPFTNTGIAALPDEQGNFTPADLLNDPNALVRWRKRVGEQIDKSKNIYQLFMLFNKPYYLTFIKYAASYLSEKDLGQILSDAWIMSEFPNADTVDFLREANGEQVFFEDHMRMESFRNDPEIFEAVQMLHRELERSAPVRGMVLGGMK